MDYIIKLAFVLLIFMYSWFFQVQNQEWDIDRELLKSANNMAVHDAAQQLDEAALADGRLVIDLHEAEASFREALKANLGLDDSLTPLAGSRLSSKVEIVDFEVIDDASGRSFPFLYEDSRFGITKYLQGPSVIAVIKTRHPVLLARAKLQDDIQVPAVQEYKPDK
ncbi:hypothetical protein KIH86_12605 [Paenibacillus sp. HN-1]|uniref:hypothetical protein n=1 Tax=Paenibacillus TaxID=44249 RepID=UPI001CA87FC3|nr:MULTISPECIES: hypothetical protein [Paenibacillus]MBY9080942.1 hypothetical protein [Paenibacillus sp. CGMCC 1.18879]MBY9085066.1 hypothetical protein [Paenibacillus sinensis]